MPSMMTLIREKEIVDQLAAELWANFWSQAEQGTGHGQGQDGGE